MEQEIAGEKAKRIAARNDLIVKVSRGISSFLKSILRQTKPFFRVAFIVGIIALLLWGGFTIIPKLNLLIPTVKPETKQRINATSTSSILSIFSPKSTATPTKTRTPVPTSLPTEIKDVKNVSMVLVPEGKFTMGTSNKDYTYYLDVDQNPAHSVFLDTFYIDKYEVTNSLYEVCVDDGICTKPQNRSSNNRPQYYGNPEFDNYPVIYVDWYQAKAYCEWRGARLPTEAEWEKAARGTDGRYYSWTENVNGGANTTGSTVWTGDTTKVGSYPLGKSPYGAYDMIGNVWEWVNDWYKSDYYSTLGDNATNPQGSSEGDSKVLRGGSWTPCWRVGGGACVEGSANTFNRHRDYPSRFYYDVGFRCAKDLP
jgi:formylglycine-generating enzyme required for sulfatase activity